MYKNIGFKAKFYLYYQEVFNIYIWTICLSEIMAHFLNEFLQG